MIFGRHNGLDLSLWEPTNRRSDIIAALPSNEPRKASRGNAKAPVATASTGASCLAARSEAEHGDGTLGRSRLPDRLRAIADYARALSFSRAAMTDANRA